MINMYIYPLYLCAVVFTLLYLIYKVIIIPCRCYPKDLTFEKALNILEKIISIELEIYEKDIFDYQETITNAQYENYLRDIVTKVDSAITPDIMRIVKVYMTEDEIYTWMVRVIRRYFDDKADVNIIIEDEEEN